MCFLISILRPESPAVIDGLTGQVTTRGQLADQILRVAGWMQGQIEPGTFIRFFKDARRNTAIFFYVNATLFNLLFLDPLYVYPYLTYPATYFKC